MYTAEGATVQSMINKLFLTVLVEHGVIDRDDAIEGFREARRQISATNLEPCLRASMVREIDSLLGFLELVGAGREVH